MRTYHIGGIIKLKPHYSGVEIIKIEGSIAGEKMLTVRDEGGGTFQWGDWVLEKELRLVYLPPEVEVAKQILNSYKL
jgi:hypothetical protein